MKKIISVLFAIVLLSISVAAFSMPHPIYGHIESDTLPLQNVEIFVENLNTGMEATTHTDVNGFYQIDLGNLDDYYRDGDSIRVSLVYCKNLAICTRSTLISGGGNEVSWDIVQDGVVAPLPHTITIVKYVCWNGAGVESESDCPLVPVVEKIICEDGTEVTDKADCPEKTDSWVYALIAAIIALVGGLFGGGWKIYNGKFKHYHRGLTSYHDPSDRHRNAKYRHTRWNEGALKCISDVKKIQQGIDLSK